MRPVVQGLAEEGVGDPQDHVGGGRGARCVLAELGVVDGEEGPEVAAVF